MATIYNSNLTKEIIDTGKLQISRDIIPSQFAEKVVPVVDVNPKHARVCNIIRRTQANNNTSATVYTTPTDKEFYLVSYELSLIKDATSTSVGTYIEVTIDGATQILAYIDSFTLTAQAEAITGSFPIPIKIDKGSNINLRNSTNVANCKSDLAIIGFTVDNINA